VCGPVSTTALRPWLKVPNGVPEGLGGTPVNHIVLELLRRGRTVVVVSCDMAVPPGEEVVIQGDRLRLCYGPYRPQHRARDAFKVERAYVAEALRREAPAVVHAQWTYEFALGAYASGRPTIVTCRDWAPAVLHYMPNPYRVVRLGMQFATLARGRYFTAVSDYIRSRIAPIARGPVDVVPNGLADDMFKRSPRIPGDPPLLLTINHGAGPDGPVHRWARERDLDRDTEFRGPLPYAAIGAALDTADVLVHPSREEAFGYVLIEAMARGVPVVGGRRSGAVPWVLDEGRAGVLADVRSPPALAGAVEWLLKDRTRWLHYSTAGYARAWRTFRIERVVDAYERWYTHLLRSQSAPR
jgi:L-malate glycosyltransferase